MENPILEFFVYVIAATSVFNLFASFSVRKLVATLKKKGVLDDDYKA